MKKLFQKDKLINLIIPILIPSFFFFFYLKFQSISYDDWDSIQFALGMKDFNLKMHQPHSPGYPVYIFILRIIDIFVNDPLRSMTFLSALSGSLGVLVFYNLLRILFKPRKQKILIPIFTLLLGFFPLYSVNSIKALSDIPALTLYLIWLLLFVRTYRKINGFKNSKSNSHSSKTSSLLIILALFSGITIGVRIQIVTGMIIPFILIIYKLLAKSGKKALTKIIPMILAGLAGTLLWMIPVIVDSGGIKEFYNLMMGRYLWRYKIHGHTPFEYGFAPGYFLEHAINHIYNLVRSGVGITLPYQQFSNASTNLKILLNGLLILILITAFYLLIKNIRKEKVQIFLLSGLPYLLFMYLNLNYENARYWLPLIPFILIFGLFITLRFASKFNDKQIQTVVTTLIPTIVLIFFTSKSLEFAEIIHNEYSANTKAINYIKNEYGEDNTVFLNCSHMNRRHFQYLTKKEMEFIDEYSSEEIQQIVKSNNNTNLISCQCHNTAAILKNFEKTKTVSFYRDLRPHWKHNFIEICKFEYEE